MNLTIEQMREIVDGAPAIANFYIPSKAGYTRMGSVLLDGAISLNDLRTELAKHEPMELRAVDIPHGTIVLEK